MKSKELAHAAHRSLQARAGCDIGRSHVYELLAALFGYQSWAAFQSDSVLTDAGVGQVPEGGAPGVIARAIQMQYAQGHASVMAEALKDFADARQLGALRWTTLVEWLLPAPCYADEDEDEDEDDFEGDTPMTATCPPTPSMRATSCWCPRCSWTASSWPQRRIRKPISCWLLSTAAPSPTHISMKNRSRAGY